jgi:hypothetical protein
MKLFSKLHVRWLDIVIFGLAVALVLGTSLLVLNRHSGTSYVHITGESGEWIAPLNKEATYEVPGPLGITVVHIHDGKVAIEVSPCRNKICVLSGAISSPGQWVACLPNQVFVRITSGESDDEGGVDAGVF